MLGLSRSVDHSDSLRRRQPRARELPIATGGGGYFARQDAPTIQFAKLTTISEGVSEGIAGCGQKENSAFPRRRVKRTKRVKWLGGTLIMLELSAADWQPDSQRASLAVPTSHGPRPVG